METILERCHKELALVLLEIEELKNAKEYERIPYLYNQVAQLRNSIKCLSED